MRVDFIFFFLLGVMFAGAMVLYEEKDAFIIDGDKSTYICREVKK